MSLDEAEKFYHTAYRCCQLISKVPEPIMIQHLVTAWRVLRIRGGERRKTDTPLKEGGPEGCLPARPTGALKFDALFPMPFVRK